MYACKLARQNKTKLYKEKKYLGYCAAKQEYYIGFKGYMISDVNGNPIQFMITPGCESVIGAFKKIDLNLPINSFYMQTKPIITIDMKIN